MRLYFNEKKVRTITIFLVGMIFILRVWEWLWIYPFYLDGEWLDSLDKAKNYINCYHMNNVDCLAAIPRTYNVGSALALLPIYKIWGFSYDAFKITHIVLSAAFLIFLLSSIELRSRFLTVFALTPVVVSENLLTSILNYKWHFWTLPAFVSGIFLIRSASVKERQREFFGYCVIMLISIICYHVNIFFAALSLIIMFIKNRRSSKIGLMLFALLGAGVYLGTRQGGIASRIITVLNYRREPGDWSQHIHISLQRSYEAITEYFSVWVLLALFIGIIIFIKSKASRDEKAFILFSFGIPVVAQTFTEGLLNIDWHLWFWGPMIYLSVLSWDYLVWRGEKCLELNNSKLIKASILALIFSCSIMASYSQWGQIRAVLFKQPYQFSAYAEKTDVQAAAIGLVFMREHPGSVVYLPTPKMAVSAGGFDLTHLLKFQEAQDLIKSGRIKFFDNLNFAKELNQKDIFIFTSFGQSPPPQNAEIFYVSSLRIKYPVKVYRHKIE